MATTPDVKTSPARVIDHEASVENEKNTPAIVGNLTGAAIRFDGFPDVSGGENNFGLNWNAVQAGSHVYISASEVDNNGNRFNSTATFTVQNIIPLANRVEFKILIGTASPVRISLDVLAINP